MTASQGNFTDDQVLFFRGLRERYAADPDCFTDRERAQLSFIRWLCETGSTQTGPQRGNDNPSEDSYLGEDSSQNTMVSA